MLPASMNGMKIYESIIEFSRLEKRKFSFCTAQNNPAITDSFQTFYFFFFLTCMEIYVICTYKFMHMYVMYTHNFYSEYEK